MSPTNRHLWAIPTGGDIGEESEEEIILEPFPEEVPVTEPAAPTPAREPVPA